jgi:hypothetical protein
LRSGVLQEGVGFADFSIFVLLPAVQAVHSWEPPSHQQVSDIKKAYIDVMQPAMSTQMKDNKDKN